MTTTTATFRDKSQLYYVPQWLPVNSWYKNRLISLQWNYGNNYYYLLGKIDAGATLRECEYNHGTNPINIFRGVKPADFWKLYKVSRFSMWTTTTPTIIQRKDGDDWKWRKREREISPAVNPPALLRPFVLFGYTTHNVELKAHLIRPLRAERCSLIPSSSLFAFMMLCGFALCIISLLVLAEYLLPLPAATFVLVHHHPNIVLSLITMSA